jgi:hypothetical protein
MHGHEDGMQGPEDGMQGPECGNPSRDAAMQDYFSPLQGPCEAMQVLVDVNTVTDTAISNALQSSTAPSGDSARHETDRLHPSRRVQMILHTRP